MRKVFLFSLILSSSLPLIAQTPATGTGTAKPRATTGTRPATTTPAPAGRSGVALTVTDMGGLTLPGVTVELIGPSDRKGETSPGGQLNFPGLQAGTYRLQFSGENVTAYEREVSIPAGKTVTLDISLNPAPPPREIIKEIPVPAPPVAAAPAAPVIGPLGSPQALSLYDMAERELKSKTPQREVLVACSGNLRTTLVTLVREDQAQRMYEGAEVSYYVLGGDPIVKIDGKDAQLSAGGYFAVPRGVPFSITRKGNKAVSLLALLSGAPCEEAR
jgi:mannose-6-phosphate isomerase-like protein (cupin superfamily)